MTPPVRRSPVKLRSTASASTESISVASAEEAASNQPDAHVVRIETPKKSDSSKTVPSKPAGTSLAAKSANASNMQAPLAKEVVSESETEKRLHELERQLHETRSELVESRRKCQLLESTSSSSEVSDHNLNLSNVQIPAAIAFTNTTTYDRPHTYAINAAFPASASVATPSTQAANAFNLIGAPPSPKASVAMPPTHQRNAYSTVSVSRYPGAAESATSTLAASAFDANRMQPTSVTSATMPLAHVRAVFDSSMPISSNNSMPPFSSNVQATSVTSASMPLAQVRAVSDPSMPVSSNNFMPPFASNVQPSHSHAAFDVYRANRNGHEFMMPRKIQDLPDFGGQPEDWPLFYTAYCQSTAVYGYTNFENNQRLQKCLKAEAKEVVKSLLIQPDSVNEVINQLKFRFGRPEQLINSQLKSVRELPFINENNLPKLIPFATKVKNLSVFLKSVNGEQHIANPSLLEELIMKLPMSKRLEWAKIALNIKPYATIAHFGDWLCELANLICLVQDANTNYLKRRVLHAAHDNEQCLMCKANHKINECRQFLNLEVEDRWAFVKKSHACFSCLNVGHTSRECRKKKQCAKEGCQRKHNVLLHADKQNSDIRTQPNQTNPATESNNQNVLSCSNNNKKLLFRVLPVTLYGDNCQADIFALFDDGSSITMIDKDIAQQIGVRGRKSQLNIQWFGGRSASEPSMTFNVKISGAEKKKKHLLRNVYAVSNLNLPKQTLSEAEIKACFKDSPRNAMKPYSNVVPKLLIGLDHSWLGLPSNIKAGKGAGPYACNTDLGWVVYGPCKSISSPSRSCVFVNIEEEKDIHTMVQDYFNIENIAVRAASPVESDDDILAKEILHSTTKRIGKRFQTGLLWKKDDVKLEDSYSMALARLEGIERKLNRCQDLDGAYREVINTYIKKGYARKVLCEEADQDSEKKWYLPHFCVINPNKEKKKIRLVFDAAAKVNGVSLNDNLLKGPQFISSLPSILFNFRSRMVAVSADICEMFHQVLVQESDRISQRFLWRENRSLPPEEYEMRVLIFGAACSPCSAIHVMQTNAKENSESNPRATKAICEHHYMDDFVDSFDTKEEAIEVSKQVQEIHRNGGFELRGFISNSNEVVMALDGAPKPKAILGKNGTEKVLGLFWDAESDMFLFKLKFNKIDQNVIFGSKRPTKRQVLSIIMSTFDPLGFLSHFTVGGKLVLRRIWKSDVKWDEPIPDDINITWEQWRKQLRNVSKFRVPRFYFRSNDAKRTQLHIFVDSSEEAFAAVAYWRTIEANGSINVSFVCSKTKSAPLVKVSVPRLELQAAVLGTRVKDHILQEHDIILERITIWSDSKTVLRWIASSHRRYKPYVAHRIAEILQSTEISHWEWIPTSENVADDATRSYKNIDLSESSRWLQGPVFLKLKEDDWPNYGAQVSMSEDEDEEILSQKTLLVIAENDVIKFERFSSYRRLKRSIACALRFVKKCRRKGHNLGDCYGLTANEMEASEETLCRQVQREAFADGIRLIETGQPIPKGHSLHQLSPYVDEKGLLRVYGRIDAASYLPYSMRRPIILPKGHRLSYLIVAYYHYEMAHQNHEAKIGEIRKKFWIMQVRSLLKTVITSCCICRLNRAKPVVPIMGQLPMDRLESGAAPFKYTGLDYFGPLNVSIGRRTEKRWVALFTCLSIRAIHLEIAHDLSTDSCIIALRNFMNRRGVPSRIRSDNGKNFVGAKEEAKKFEEVFDAERIQQELSGKGVQWIFNCPVNPSEGGVWERMVQCVKRVLRHTMKDESPKEHVLQSLLIEAENIINSRPLTHLPVSPNEEEPLTPNHFLIGMPNIPQTPVFSEKDIKLCSIRKRWRIVRALRNRFWKRWVLEYLPTLTRRVKWCERTKPIEEGDVVFICDPNLQRKQWRRGLVTRVYTGADGVARRADVSTASGVLQRAVSKLAVLDVGEADCFTGAGVLQT